jgi:hypothetical protein
MPIKASKAMKTPNVMLMVVSTDRCPRVVRDAGEIRGSDVGTGGKDSSTTVVFRDWVSVGRLSIWRV